jgi:hypothetical protein
VLVCLFFPILLPKFWGRQREDWKENRVLIFGACSASGGTGSLECHHVPGNAYVYRRRAAHLRYDRQFRDVLSGGAGVLGDGVG